MGRRAQWEGSSPCKAHPTVCCVPRRLAQLAHCDSAGAAIDLLARARARDCRPYRGPIRVAPAVGGRGGSRVGGVGCRGGGEVFVEIAEEQAQLGEALGAELVLPFALDGADDVAHRLRCASAAAGERDALEALVAGIVAPLQVAEALELAEQIVQGLFTHAALCGQL